MRRSDTGTGRVRGVRIQVHIDMKLQMQALLALAVLILSGPVFALGVGKLEQESALNERFEARIPITSATADELSTLQVGLASAEMFSRLNIERASELRKLSFELVETETGHDYIHITSRDPIREPYLSFLVELSWANGRIFREYTVLLDPPAYDPATGRLAAPEPTRAPPVADAPPADPGPYRHDVLYPDDMPRPAGVPAVPYTDGDYGPVREGETLWSIANTMRPANVTANQMMLALLRSNPEAFLDNNINALRAGAVLRMPDSDEFRRLGQAEALAEVQRHYSLWEDSRLAMAEAPVERPDTVTPPAAVETDDEPADTEVIDAEESELRLLAATDMGEARPGDEDGVEFDQLRGELAVAAEDLESARQENIELKERLIEAEELIDDLQRLIALKDDELASLQRRMEEETEAPVAEPVVEPVVEEEEDPEAVAAVTEPPVTTPTEALPPEAPEPGVAAPGILGMITGYLADARNFVMTNLTMVGGGLAVLLALIAAGVFVSRRQAATAGLDADQDGAVEFPDFSADEDTGATSFDVDAEADAGMLDDGGEAVTELPGGADVDEAAVFDVPETQSAPVQAGEPEDDPLAEVNVLMAYEHFDQAEEQVRKAIAEQPENAGYHVKLLEVFYAASNKKKYEEAARVLRDLTGGEGEHWSMAVAMWQEMSPSRALFEAAADEEEEVATASTGSGIVDITGDTAGGAQADSDDGDLDFDLGDTSGQTAASSAADEGILDLSMGEEQDDDGMLDLTAGEEQQEDDDGLLDLTAAMDEEGESDSAMLAATAAASSESDDGSLDFDLTSGGGEPAEESGEDPLDVTRDSHVELEAGEDLLDVTSAMRPSADTADIDDGTEAEGDGGLDFALDDTGESVAETPAMAADDDNVLEFDGGGMDFDTGTEESEQAQLEEDTTTEAAGDAQLIDFEMEAPAADSGSDTDTSLDDIGAELGELEQSLSSDQTQAGLVNTSDAMSGIDDSLELGETDNETFMSDTSDALKGIDEVVMDEVSDSEASTEAGNATDSLEIDDNAGGETLDSGDSITDLAAELEIDFDSDAESGLSEDRSDEDVPELDLGNVDHLDDLSSLSVQEDQSGEADIELDAGMDDGGIELELDGETDDGSLDTDLEISAGSEEAAQDSDLSLSDDLSLEVDDLGDTDIETDLSTASDDTGLSMDLENDESTNDQDMSIDMDATVELPKSRMPAGGLSLEADADDEGEGDHTVFVPRSGDAEEQSLEDELTTKLDLAKAYVELGDAESARGILEEVMRDGSDAQKNQAGELLQQI